MDTSKDTEKDPFDIDIQACSTMDCTGIKNRTRATMGRCQGGYCETRITAMIQEELGIDERQVRYSKENSYMFTGKVR